MKKDLLVVGHIFADETTMPTLRTRIPDNLGKKTKTNYIWVYNGPSKADKKFPIVIYDFTEGRDGKYPKGFLEGFSGYVQVDAYSGYDGLFANLEENKAVCIEVGCWGHVRRYFYEALQANPKSIAAEVLTMIGQLYTVERECRVESLKAEEIQKRRQEQSKPALNQIHDWLVKHQPQVLPKSLLGQAISYALNNWKALNVYVNDGRLEIDNNRSERELFSKVGDGVI